MPQRMAAQQQLELADQLARQILGEFDAFYSRWLELTYGAKMRFENADWYGNHVAAKQRIQLYSRHVDRTADKLKRQTAQLRVNRRFRSLVKQSYAHLLQDYPNFEIAESYYNSVYRRLFRHRINGDQESQLFVTSTRQRDYEVDARPHTHYYRSDNPRALFEQLLSQVHFTIPWEDKARDLQYLCQALEEDYPQVMQAKRLRLEVFSELFYRNKAAYIIGRLKADDTILPFVLPLLNNEKGGIYTDTLLLDSNEISIIFGFARAYFFVYAPEPGALVSLLQILMPNKTPYELFASIGCPKHAKTEFMRHYSRHLASSQDDFCIAPGIPGMVMSVFTLPSYDVVFKIIKDRSARQKSVSREVICDRYTRIKQHDRVGRMADTQEFRNFHFPLERISPELLEELQQVAPSCLRICHDQLIIKHLYVERRMEPLNLFLDQGDDQDIEHGVIEYGNAIKQIAMANIFPGDMLFKNFGLTRHNRVIFYDYDEICYLTECNFRRIPQAMTYEQEMSDEPWYSVAPNDVFPEEFIYFLSANAKVKDTFLKYHSDLLDADYWRLLQENIENGAFSHAFPYRQQRRFRYRFSDRPSPQELSLP